MEEGTRQWLMKIESKLDAVNDKAIEKWTEVSTKLDIFMPSQVEQIKRLDQCEKEIAEIKQDNANRSKNHNILLGVGTIAGAIIAVIVGVLIDHYLIR
jgi:F0F1-type ATP synthase assembly protein I